MDENVQENETGNEKVRGAGGRGAAASVLDAQLVCFTLGSRGFSLFPSFPLQFLDSLMCSLMLSLCHCRRKRATSSVAVQRISCQPSVFVSSHSSTTYHTLLLCVEKELARKWGSVK